MWAKVEGVILDLDGLVLDTESGYWWSWKKAAESMGYVAPSALRRSLLGRDASEVRQGVLDCFGDGFEWAEFTRLSAFWWYRHVRERGIPVKRGLRRLLSLLEQNRIPYCLATNSYRENALECLEFAGLGGRFNVMVARDDVRIGKPDPEIFQLASSRLALEINRCLVLEDSPCGVAGATSAGAFTVLVPSGLPMDRSARGLSDGECRDLLQVSECLRELWG